MKKFLILFCLMFATSMTATSFAQEAQSPVSNSISVDDVRQLGAQVKALKEIVNDEPKPEPKPEPKSEKTMADVSDKALDMLGAAVGTVAETLKKIGPEVWRIMVFQQYANAGRMLAGPFFALIASIIIYFSLRKATTPIEGDREKNIEEDSDDLKTFKKVMRFITYLVPCICALICAVQLSDAIAMVINPEYYALKDLLNLMTGK